MRALVDMIAFAWIRAEGVQSERAACGGGLASSRSSSTRVQFSSSEHVLSRQRSLWRRGGACTWACSADQRPADIPPHHLASHPIT